MARFEVGPFTTAPGPRRKWSTFEIWAEDGLVCLFDPNARAERDEDPYQVLSCAAARLRLRGWAIEEIEIWDKRRTAATEPAEKGYCNDMFYKLKAMAEVLDTTIREALDQGDQNDPEVARKKHAQFIRERMAGKVGPGSPLPSTQKYLQWLHGLPAPKMMNTYRRTV